MQRVSQISRCRRGVYDGVRLETIQWNLPLEQQRICLIVAMRLCAETWALKNRRLTRKMVCGSLVPALRSWWRSTERGLTIQLRQLPVGVNFHLCDTTIALAWTFAQLVDRIQELTIGMYG